jgi:hypothetical protein
VLKNRSTWSHSTPHRLGNARNGQLFDTMTMQLYVIMGEPRCRVF